MSDQEKTKLLAEKIMGWHSYKGWWYRGVDNSLCRSEDDPLPGVDSAFAYAWNPLEKIADAWMLVQRLTSNVSNGRVFYLSRGDKGWSVTFGWQYGVTAGVTAVEETVERAICECALKCIQEADLQKELANGP